MTVAYVKRDFTITKVPVGAGAENTLECDRFDDKKLISNDQSLSDKARTAHSDSEVRSRPTVCEAKQLNDSISTSFGSSLQWDAQDITDIAEPHAITPNVQLDREGRVTTLKLMHLERPRPLRISEPSTQADDTEEDRQMKLDLDDMVSNLPNQMMKGKRRS